MLALRFELRTAWMPILTVQKIFRLLLLASQHSVVPQTGIQYVWDHAAVANKKLRLEPSLTGTLVIQITKHPIMLFASSSYGYFSFCSFYHAKCHGVDCRCVGCLL